MKKISLIVSIALVTLVGANVSYAKDGEDITDRVMETLETKEQMDREREKEEMRDTTHDNRVRVDDNTSIGVDEKGVNVRRSFE